MCIFHGLNLSVAGIAIRGKVLIHYSSDPGSNPGLVARTFTLSSDIYYSLLLEHVSSLVSRLRISQDFIYLTLGRYFSPSLM